MAAKKKEPEPELVESTEVDGDTSRHVVRIHTEDSDHLVAFGNQELLAFYKQLGAAVVGANI